DATKRRERARHREAGGMVAGEDCEGERGAAGTDRGGAGRMNLNRGFSCIALDNPKDKNNVGGAMRAAFVYEANLVVIGNGRFERSATDVFETWRNAPVLRVADVFDALPYDTVPVGVDLVDGATPLPDYEHPRRAFYVFGAEDATLGERILGRCRDRIF